MLGVVDLERPGRMLVDPREVHWADLLPLFEGASRLELREAVADVRRGP